MIASNSWKLITSGVISRQHFTTPLEGFINLSFDGASKGNPGLVGLGWLFHDSGAKSHLIYVNHCGYTSNNEAEFVAVLQGLLMAIKLGYKNMMVEGDFILVINTVKN